MRELTRRRPLGVGIQLPEVERVVRWPELVAIARRAEEVGFDSLWVGDHLLYRGDGLPARGPWEAWSVLAALAAVTERVRIGPLVAATSFHAPAMLAKKAATIDEISGGRLILGLGAGWNEAEYRAFGFPFDRRVDRFEEAFTVIRLLLREGRADFHGQYYTVDDCLLLPPPSRAGGPPLMIGSTGERMLRITAPWVNAWNAWFDAFGNQPERLRPLMERVDAAAEAAARDPASIERTVAVYVALAGATGRGMSAERREIAPVSGPADAIADRLHEFAQAGIAHVQLVVDPITLGSVEELGAALERLDAG